MGNAHSSGKNSASSRGNATNNPRRESGIISRASSTRRPQQLGAVGVGGGSNSSSSSSNTIDFASQRGRPTTGRSRLSHGFTPSTNFGSTNFGSIKEASSSSSFKDSHGLYQQNSPYSGLASESRVSLLSMVASREDSAHDDNTEITRLSLGPAVKPTKSSRALSGYHPTTQLAGRPRSRTQSSEQGVVTVFSGIQKPPPLDPDLEALNNVPKYRPLVLAPSNNRLTGLFQSGTRYVEPSAEQLNLDETELTGICFSFRSYVSDRVQRICDRQSDLVIAAKHASARSTDSSSRLSYVTQLAKQDREGVVLLKSLQRQAEKSYELMQEILHDLERLEVVLPANERFFGSNSAAPKEFPNLSKMLHQRRRNSLPSNSPSLGTIMRRQMASKKTGIPAFVQRGSHASAHTKSASIAHSMNTAAGDVPKGVRSPTPSLVHRASPLSPSRSHSKYMPDALSLRRKVSRSSVSSSELAVSSRSSSPNLTSELRSSFDGASPTGTALSNSSQLWPRLSHRRAVHPYSTARRPNSVASTIIDSVYYSGRSEPSLSNEQVLWSPQPAIDAGSSSFSHALATYASPESLVDEPASPRSHAVSIVSESHGDRPNLHANIKRISTGANEGGAIGAEKISHEQIYQSSMPIPIASSNAFIPANHQKTDNLAQHACTPSSSSRNIQSPESFKQPVNAIFTTTSPQPVPRKISIPSASSMASSSPSIASMLLHSPLASPTALVSTNALSVVTTSESAAGSNNTPLGSPKLQRHSEATRMLKQAMAEQQTRNDRSALSTPSNSRPASQNISPERTHHLLISAVSQQAITDDVFADAKKSIAGTINRSRASSMAHSLINATEEKGRDQEEEEEASGNIADTVIDMEQSRLLHSDSSQEHTPSDEPAAEFKPMVRTNPERMSTWSSSSAKTLAEGIYSFRAPLPDESRNAKLPPVSAALSTLTASAAMINNNNSASNTNSKSNSSTNSRPPSRDKGGSLSSATGVRYFNAHIRRARPAADLGLAIRSDLERRVRSFSASESDPSSPNDARPHSSMGFHETAYGAAVQTTRPDSIYARRHSPHSVSLRFSRPNAFQRHRLSMVSTSSQSSSRPGSTTSEKLALESTISASTTATNSTNQAPDKLPPPPPPPLLSTHSAVQNPPANPAVAGKRRAHTMGPPKAARQPTSTSAVSK